jgi:uncharacterized membrane protein YphA (DoxX/SURF4 family)
MHPLSIFPQLFFLGFVAPLLLRLSAGFFLIYLGKNRTQKTYGWLAILYIAAGVLLILGLYTQIAAIVSILIISFDFLMDKGSVSFSTEKKILYFVIKIILISLLLTGPGFLAFDLPL